MTDNKHKRSRQAATQTRHAAQNKAQNREQSQMQPSDPDEVRLNVLLQESGVASRRKADELIAAGMVKVNGKTVTQLGTRINRSDKVHVHGKLLTVKSLSKVIYILNKPDMCLTTRFDAKGRRTIFDLPAVKSLPSNVQAVGRLDYRSEGLLLLTNDGDLAYALTHPKFSVEKTYAVLVADGVTIEDVEKLRAGVMLDDGMAKAVSVRMGNKERLGATRGQWLELVVTEGRNRLIRRMAETIGLKVVRLVRIGMGDVVLPATLKPGQTIAVDAGARAQLEQIKNEMMESRDSSPTVEGKRASDYLDEATRAKRKLRRQIKLTDEEYQLEATRRSAEAAVKRRERVQLSRAAQTSDARPIHRERPLSGPIAKTPTDDGPRPANRSSRDTDSRPIPAKKKSEATRSGFAERRDDRGPRSTPTPVRSSRDEVSRPTPRNKTPREDASRPAPRKDASRGETSRPSVRRDNARSETPRSPTRRDAPRSGSQRPTRTDEKRREDDSKSQRSRREPQNEKRNTKANHKSKRKP